MRIIVIALLCLVAFSCYNAKKATKQVNKAAVSYPGLIADKAAVMFPCVPLKGDTVTTYVSDSAAYQETIDLLYSQIQSNSVFLDSLLDALQTGDTACRKY
jgi:hypothetical protein